jgi:hypothetical protein
MDDTAQKLKDIPSPDPRDDSEKWVVVAEAVDENEAMVSIAYLRENRVDATRGGCNGVLPDGEREDVPGVWIWARTAMAEQAKTLLAQWQTPPALKGCPNCGSTEIYRNKKVTIYEWVFGWFHLPTLTRMIGEGFQPRHECFRCGFRWSPAKPWRAFPVIAVMPHDSPASGENEHQ